MKTDASFGNYLCIKDLESDSIFKTMRYNSDTLNIVVLFLRDNIRVAYWTKLYIKTKISFIDGTSLIINYKETDYRYEGDTAIASFSLTLNTFSPIKSLTLWGKRPSVLGDNEEDDIKSKTYYIDKSNEGSLTKILSNLWFNNNDTLSITLYENYYYEISSPLKGEIVSYPQVLGTSEYLNYFSNKFHYGWIAIKPTPVIFLGKARYPKISFGIASSDITMSGAFIQTELITFLPTDDNWKYFKLPEEYLNINVSPVMFLYRIGNYVKNIYYDNLNTMGLKCLLDLKTSLLDFLELDSELRKIISISKISDGVYKIILLPWIDKKFKFYYSKNLLPYEIENNINYSIGFSEYSSFDPAKTTWYTGGLASYIPIEDKYQIVKLPNYGNSAVTITKDGYKLEGTFFKDDSVDAFMKIEASNKFTSLKEFLYLRIGINKNEKPVILPEAIIPLFRLRKYSEATTFSKDENYYIKEEEEYKFLGKIEKFETGKTYYTNTNNFKELTPLILNPYEELAFYLNPHYCYNPDTYLTGKSEQYTGYINLYYTISNDLNEEVVFEEKKRQGRLYNFTNDNNLIIKLYEKLSDLSTSILARSYYNFISKEYENYNELLLVIKVINEEPIYSLNYTKFLNIGALIGFYSNNIFIENKNSDIININTIRLGRVLPMLIKDNSCFLNLRSLTYTINDYGGDKLENNNTINFINSDNSISRTGNEKLELILFQKDIEKNIEKEIGKITINNNKDARNLFLEDIPRLFIVTFSSGVDLSAIPEKNKVIIKGTYNYSYDGSNEEQTYNFEIENVLISLKENPTIGIRKNAVIINGEENQKISNVEQGNENSGKYFLEINALNTNDRIVFKFPSDIKAEIYYNATDNKVHLSGFIIDP